MDEIERVLGIAARADELAARRRPDFRGVYDLEASAVLSTSGRRAARATSRWRSRDPADPRGRRDWSASERQRELIEAVEIISGAGTRFDPARTGRAADAGVLRQRAERLRRRAVPQARS